MLEFRQEESTRDVSPDGQRFLISRSVGAAQTTVLLNWTGAYLQPQTYSQNETWRAPNLAFRHPPKREMPQEGHFILAETYLCCLGACGRIVILDCFLNPWC